MRLISAARADVGFRSQPTSAGCILPLQSAQCFLNQVVLIDYPHSLYLRRGNWSACGYEKYIQLSRFYHICLFKFYRALRYEMEVWCGYT